jgi:hypothetical protein
VAVAKSKGARAKAKARAEPEAFVGFGGEIRGKKCPRFHEIPRGIGNFFLRILNFMDIP